MRGESPAEPEAEKLSGGEVRATSETSDSETRDCHTKL